MAHIDTFLVSPGAKHFVLLSRDDMKKIYLKAFSNSKDSTQQECVSTQSDQRFILHQGSLGEHIQRISYFRSGSAMSGLLYVLKVTPNRI